MRLKNYPLFTIKNKKINNNSFIKDYLIKSGLIRKLSSGIYSLMPNGLKIINKINDLIKYEMKKINSIEILIPILHPINIWENSNKFDLYKSELFFCRSFNGINKYILNPTNEEIIINILKNEIKSKTLLPLIVFQINSKFRNELRCKNSLLRTKEFIMKDAYSFHKNKKCLNKTYEKIIKTYKNIFNKLEMNIFINKADPGYISDNLSHEFHVLSKYGENNIAICKLSNKSGNIDVINNLKNNKNNYFLNINKKINIINEKNLTKNNFLKVFILYANQNYISSKFIAVVIKNNHKLSIFKLKNIKYIKKPIKFANNNDIYSITKSSINYIGILNLKIPIIIDYDVEIMNNFTTGANINGKFFNNVNWYRDIKIPIVSDIRKINNNDISPFNKNSNLFLKKSIEIAHTFKLNYNINKENNLINNKLNVIMGSYGIGITRILFSIIENNFYKNKIKWPYNIYPFKIALIPINIKNINIKKKSEEIYYFLIKNNIDVFFNDKEEYFGNTIFNMDIIGIPNLIIISEKNLKNKNIEYINKYKNIKLLINKNIFFNKILDILKETI